jgi:molecular chaperone GrpE
VAEDKNLKEEEIMNEETVEEVTEECETAEEVTEDTECEACSEEDKKKGFFNKNKKDKKDPKDIQIEELSDKYRRTMAEFDNFRKRTEKEKAAMYEIGAKDIINKLLPVVDNFERGLASIPEADKGTPVADGMDKIYKQLTKMLEEAGVKEIEAEGQEFNPDFHNAVMHIDDETLGENVVAEVLLKGYTYRDSVVRHSMVKVAN